MAASLNSQDGDHGFQIAPMVDVVFVLLLFFMALAGARQIETRLEVDVPTRGIGDADPPIAVDISAAGEITVNGSVLVAANTRDVTEMETWLSRRAFATKDTAFVIRPDANTQHARFIQVLDVLQRGGFRKVTFA